MSRGVEYFDMTLYQLEKLHALYGNGLYSESPIRMFLQVDSLYSYILAVSYCGVTCIPHGTQVGGGGVYKHSFNSILNFTMICFVNYCRMSKRMKP